MRPGRVDFKAEIGLCTEHQLARMFSRFYPPATSMNCDVVSVHPLAANFASTLGNGLVSAAQVQGFLLVHKESPQSAMDALPGFREECIRQRDGTKVESR